jgi:fructose-bisphosphate aldolase, class II
VAKVNVATTLNQVLIGGIKVALAKNADETDPRKVIGVGRDAVKEAVREKIRLFGSAGTIDSAGGFRTGKKVVRSAELGEIE